MGGFFGVVSNDDCANEVFFGTDYHSHLGTMRGGMAILDHGGFTRYIHNITNTQFRSKFEDDLPKMRGNRGIGVISDYDDQPLIVRSHLGTYAIVTVGSIQNVEELAQRLFVDRSIHFAEMRGSELNPTELAATLINRGATFVEGIQNAQENIVGSCSLLLLCSQGIYAARDRLGRTPVAIGRRPGAVAVTMETCALPNLEFEIAGYLGPGEIVRISAEGVERLRPPGERLQICSFLWVYYGYPASAYEGINVEEVRNRCGVLLARADDQEIDIVAGIPDSGIGHAIGYAGERGIPYRRPFVKYTPTWPRSFMPQDQSMRELVARMKLIPVRELISGKRLLFCEDSIVRGTQLRDTIQRLYACGALEVHMRPACPPLLYNCKFLNFSSSRSELDLAARKAIEEIRGDSGGDPAAYSPPDSAGHARMVERIQDKLRLTTLRYQRLDDLVAAIGLPKEKLCTYCWDGAE